MTTLDYLKKTFFLYIIAGSFDEFSNKDSALKTRLGSCIRKLEKPFPSISPIIEVKEGDNYD